jgi:mannosyltransferase
VLATPVIVLAVLERGQLSFLGHRSALTARTFFGVQWFMDDYGVAVLAWMAIGAAAAGWLVVAVRRWRRSGHVLPLHPVMPSLRILAVAWLVIPPALLFLANTFVAPLYTVRYGSFVTPAVAIVLGLAIDRLTWLLRHRWVAVAATAALVAICIPTDIGLRGPYAKDPVLPGKGSDWAEVAQVVDQHARPGDDVVFDGTVRPSLRTRLIMRMYPQDFAGLVDVALKSPYQDNPGLWDTAYTIPQVASRLAAGNGRVWLIEYDDAGSAGNDHRMEQLQAQGFRLTSTFTLERDSVYLLTKGSGS